MNLPFTFRLHVFRRSQAQHDVSMSEQAGRSLLGKRLHYRRELRGIASPNERGTALFRRLAEPTSGATRAQVDLPDLVSEIIPINLGCGLSVRVRAD